MADELWRATGIESGTRMTVMVEGRSMKEVLIKLNSGMLPVTLTNVWKVENDTSD
jgi:hypothetical protein